MKTHLYNYRNIIVTIVLIALFNSSCKKRDEWLNVKNNKSSVVPETVDDYQAILSNNYIFNEVYSTPGVIGSDNFYLTDSDFNGIDETDRNLYTWNKKIWSNINSYEWNNLYKVIELSNLTIEGLKKLSSKEPNFNNVMGQALFHRAWAYYYLSQLFCQPFSHVTANSNLGLPLRISSDVNIIYQRSTLLQTYNQIISDAKQASTLLAKSQPYKYYPVKAAAYALLAKTYLHMEDYNDALDMATAALSLNSELLDFNNTAIVSMASTYRFPLNGQNNPEILFYAFGATSFTMAALVGSPGIVDDDLYKSYNEFDLRKSIFYDLESTGIKYRGTYTGDYLNFSGLATNEVYLIRAECNARLANIADAMLDLNFLLKMRFMTDKFSNLTASNPTQALNLVLIERRKELPFVGNIRWEDLRRLNKETSLQKTLIRVVNGTTYTLLPNDKRYTLPIPDQEIQLSGVQQNER